MDDLTKIKGIGKATAGKLADAGFDSFAKLAALTDEELAKLQEAGFAVSDIDAWKTAAAELEQIASQGDGGNGDVSLAADEPVATAGVPFIRVAAPVGARRRAGLSFTNVPRDVTREELGATQEEQEDALKKLFADPALSVSPVSDFLPAHGGPVLFREEDFG